MTRQFTRPSLGGEMELDLDAFLASQSTSDDDGRRLHSVPHRIVDEILNDSSSSSSSPPSSLNESSVLYRPRFSSDQEEVTSVSSPKTLPDSKFLDDNSVESKSKFSWSNRMGSAEFSVNSLSLGRGDALRPLPPLFGSGVRSTVKPGAALAAAVAASRSIPTPHAAALKSRRASSCSSATLLNAVGNQELDSKAEVVLEAGVSSDGWDSFPSEICQPDGKLVQEEDVQWDNYQSSEAEADTKVDVTPEISREGDTTSEVGRVFSLEASVVNDSQEVSPGSHIDPHIISLVNPEDNTKMSVSNDFKDDQVPSSSLDENKGAILEFGEGTEITDNGIASNPGSYKGSNIGEELPIVMVETSEIDKVKHLSRDGVSLTGGDESSSRNDFMDLDEDIATRLRVGSTVGTVKLNPPPDFNLLTILQLCLSLL